MFDQPGPVVPAEDEEPLAGPRVVVGVDGSAGSRAALVFALQDAARRQVPVEAVVVYRPPEFWMDIYAAANYPTDQLRTAAVERARTTIAEALREAPQPVPEIHVRAVIGGAADVLITTSQDADLLVLGSSGHGGLGSVLLGSVSMQCALHASCPVTVVHSPEAHRERLHLHLRRSRRTDGQETAQA